MQDYKISVKLENGNSAELDLYPNSNIEIVTQYIDIAQPENRKVSYIKEFEIPSTTNNNLLLAPLFDNGYTVEQINPNLGITANFTNNNIQFKGILQIVDIVNTNGKKEYRVAIYSEIAFFFNIIKGKKFIGNINLSDYNHDLTIGNIENSWDNKIIRNGQEIQTYNGEGYVYPMEDRGQGIWYLDDELVFEADKWRPSIFAKTLVDRIFQSVGYSYQSEFFNTEYFKSLVLNFSRDRLLGGDDDDVIPKEELEGMVGHASKGFETLKFFTSTADMSRPNYTHVGTNFDFKIRDIGNVYDIPAQKFTIAKTGYYSISFQEMLQLQFNDDSYNGYYLRFVGYSKKSLGQRPYVDVRIKRNGAVIATNRVTWTNIDPNVKYSKSNKSDLADFNISAGCDIQDFLLNDGDEITCDYTVTIPQGARGQYAANSGKTNIYWNTKYNPKVFPGTVKLLRVKQKENEKNSFSITINDEKDISYGEKVNLNNALPDITMEEFFQSLNKMFNLLWIPVEPNVIKIEPRDEIFKNRKKKSWTHIVDRNREIIITPMSELSSLKYIFNYEKDTDWANEKYDSENEFNFGSRVIEIENDFLQGSTEIKPIFASSPLSTLDLVGNGQYLDSDTFETGLKDFIINSYTKKDIDNKKTPHTPKTRILFWGGKIKSAQWSLKALENVDDDLNFNWLDSRTYDFYPYAGHMNSPIAPTQDLSYGVPKTFFHDWETVTNNNLFNLFWRKWITNIVSPRSHMLTVDLKMSDLEINNFDITDLIEIDNAQYNVLELIYNPITGRANAKLLKNIEIEDFYSMVGYKGPYSLKFAQNAFNFDSTIVGIGPSHSDYNLQTPNKSAQFGNYELEYPMGSNSPQLFEYVEQNSGTQFPYTQQKRSLYRTGEDTLPFPLSPEETTNGNNYIPQSTIQVNGFRNRIIGKHNTNITIDGNRNFINGGVKNINIVGNNNIIESGVENVTIIGSNQRVSQSNISIINGVTISESKIIQQIDLVEGSYNEVQNPYSPVKTIWKVDGSKNSVTNLGSDDINDVLNGSY